MKKVKRVKIGKKALSGVIVAVLITLLVIFAVVFVYSFVIPMVEKSAKEAEASPITNNIELDRNSVVFNVTLSYLQFRLNNVGQDNFSSIKAIVLVNMTSLSYNLLTVPNSLESNNYVLNITKAGEIQEIFVYPILENGKIGIGQREDILGAKNGEINENFPVINPELETSNCISNWECLDWSNCTVSYDLNNLIQDEIILKAEQSRVCTDKNSCSSDIIDRNVCDDKASVDVKKVTENGTEYVDVYDTNNNLVSRMEYKEGGVNQLNIVFPIG